MISFADIDVPKTYVRLATTKATPALVHDEFIDTFGTLDEVVQFQVVSPSSRFTAGTALRSMESMYGRSASDLFYISDSEIHKGSSQLDAYYLPSNEGVFKPYTVPVFGDDCSWHQDLESRIDSTYFPSTDSTSVIEDSEEDLSRGIQPIDFEYKVLYSTEVQVNSSELKKWKPSSFAETTYIENE